MKKIVLILCVIINTSIFAQKNPYSFTVAGHVYGTPGYPSNGVYDAMVNKFNYILSRPEIEFVVFTGDMVWGSTIQYWDYIDEDMATLGLPWYNAVGNHECSNLPLFIQRYHNPDTQFIYKNDLFILLNVYYNQWNVSQQQITAISNALSNNNYDNIFVFVHQVLWWSAKNIYVTQYPNSIEGRADSINFWTHFEPLFYNCGHNVFIFSGDVGANQSFNLYYDNYQNMHLIASGMGNKTNAENFLVVNVTDTVTIDIICLNGNSINCFGDDISIYDTYPNPHLNNLNEFLNFDLYPNPVKDYLTIENLKDFSLNIYSINGNKTLTYNIESDIEHINLEDLESGIYTLVFSNYYRTFFKKIIKI